MDLLPKVFLAGGDPGTALSPEREKEYQRWLLDKHLRETDPNDYDLRALFESGWPVDPPSPDRHLFSAFKGDFDPRRILNGIDTKDEHMVGPLQELLWTLGVEDFWKNSRRQ